MSLSHPGTDSDPPGTRDDHMLAGELAAAAGTLLLEIREGLRAGESPDRIRSEGDSRSHELLVALLRQWRPDDHVLSEEGQRRDPADAANRLWIIDPLDGTREFGEEGRDDWAVHVALVEQGELLAGAVGMPARGLTYSTSPAPAPAERNSGRLRIAVSRSRPAPEAERVAAALDAELVPMGSAGAKTIAVLTGEVDAYLHSGGQHVWDSAAPVAVARAAGLHASRIDGSPLVYGTGGTWLPDLLVCTPELRVRMLVALRALQ